MTGTDSTTIQARHLVETAGTVVVLTGAGISTASGIPDFRGPDGVWTKDPEAAKLSDINHFLASKEVREAAWERARGQQAVGAVPNAAHYALVAFERTGKLRGVVTQNIDGLHLAAGSSPDLVFEVHGSPRTTRCLRCGAETATEDILVRVAAGDSDPHCHEVVVGLVCDGLLKTSVVSFGQSLPDDVFAEAEYRIKTCDLLVCVGTSLGVQPVSGLVDKALNRGVEVIIINGEKTPYDSRANAVVRGDISEVLGEVLGVSSAAGIEKN